MNGSAASVAPIVPMVCGAASMPTAASASSLDP